jgi:DNA transposition AAA+ family ATPase
MDIEQRTKQFLESSGWSQAQLARAIGIFPEGLSRFFNARVGRGTIYEKLDVFLSSQEESPALTPPPNLHAKRGRPRKAANPPPENQP